MVFPEHIVSLIFRANKLFCTTGEVHDSEQIVAANAISVSKMTDIILLCHQLPFLNQLCEDRGIIGEPVIFQTRDNKEHKVTSIIGEDLNEREHAMYWILGEFLSHTLAHFFPIIDPAWWCRKCWLHAQRHQPRQYRRRPSRSYRAGVHLLGQRFLS